MPRLLWELEACRSSRSSQHSLFALWNKYLLFLSTNLRHLAITLQISSCSNIIIPAYQKKKAITVVVGPVREYVHETPMACAVGTFSSGLLFDISGSHVFSNITFFSVFLQCSSNSTTTYTPLPNFSMQFSKKQGFFI
jgi:hypothetical protein